MNNRLNNTGINVLNDIQYYRCVMYYAGNRFNNAMTSLMSIHLGFRKDVYQKIHLLDAKGQGIICLSLVHRRHSENRVSKEFTIFTMHFFGFWQAHKYGLSQKLVRCNSL